jgi:hypothetical protein
MANVTMESPGAEMKHPSELQTPPSVVTHWTAEQNPSHVDQEDAPNNTLKSNKRMQRWNVV